MGPGMPGFGIASIFYIGAALLSPFFEAVHVVRGTSTRERRRTALSQFMIGVLMIGALVGFYVGLASVMRRGWLSDAGKGAFGPLPNWAYALLTLLAVLGVGYVWGVITRWRLGPECRATVAQAHYDGITRIVLDLRDEQTLVEVTQSPRVVVDNAWTLSGGSASESEVMGRALLFLFPPDPLSPQPLGESVAPLELAA